MTEWMTACPTCEEPKGETHYPSEPGETPCLACTTNKMKET